VESLKPFTVLSSSQRDSCSKHTTASFQIPHQLIIQSSSHGATLKSSELLVMSLSTVTPLIVQKIKVKVKWSLYRPGVAQTVGRGIALLFHDRGTRRRWVVSSTPWPHFTPGKDPVPILQEVRWATGPVWTGGKSRPHRDSIPDRPSHSQSLYRLRYRAHSSEDIVNK